MSTITRKRGDDATDLEYRLQAYDAAGVLQYQSLAGVLAVTLHHRRGGAVASIAATPTEKSAGEWWVVVPGAQLAALAVGRYQIETEVEFATGERQTFPDGGSGSPTYDSLVIVADLADA